MERRDFEELLSALPRRRDQVLPALHVVQEAAGWLPESGIEAVSFLTSVPLSELYGIISSYSELRLAPPHAPHVELCTGLSCRMAGADALGAAARGLGVTVEEIACRFLCGVAPVAEVGGRYHGRLTPELFTAALRESMAEVPA
jgi:formate dehydrogenase subunit gamma